MAGKILYSCPYCGRIHDRSYDCGQKPTARRHGRHDESRRETRFHHSAGWARMSQTIRDRDRHLCRACLAGLDGTERRLTYEGLSVHHITPLTEDWERRLDETNLITLCPLHHRMAENGEIPRAELFDLASKKPELLFE